jgi:hypothetical protein
MLRKERKETQASNKPPSLDGHLTFAYQIRSAENGSHQPLTSLSVVKI